MSSRLEFPTSRTLRGALALATLAFTPFGCGKPAEAPPVATAAPADAVGEPLPPPAYETALPEAVREHLCEPFTGDLDQMVTRRLVRVGVAANRTFYFVDKGAQREQRLGGSRRTEPEIRRAAVATRHDPRVPGESRGRRPAGDGQCGPHPGAGRS